MGQVIRVTQQLVLVFLVIPVLGEVFGGGLSSNSCAGADTFNRSEVGAGVWNLSRAGVAVWSRRS